MRRFCSLPLVGDGRGGGSRGYGNQAPHLPTPTPDPSPQGGGEKSGAVLNAIALAAMPREAVLPTAADGAAIMLYPI